MGNCRLLVLVLLVALNKHSYCLDWSDSPQNDDVLSVCVGDDVTFPWVFLTAANEDAKDIKWQYETNSTSKLIAFYSSGEFETSEYYSHRVSYESNGSLSMTDVTMKDSGMYSISVETQDQNGVGRYQRSVALQVKDSILTEDRKVHVRQEGGAKWDNTTSTFTLTLSCGTFRFTDQQPSVQVEWNNPTGDTLNSTDYSNGRFFLSLFAPVVGGTYTCRIPLQHLSHTCLTDSRHDNNFVRVDSIQINVLQTIFEQKTLTEEAGKLKDRIANLDAEVEKVKAEDEKLKADKCPRSWTLHGESCYKFISVATTWQKAQVECESMNARLVEIDSQAENSFVFNIVVSEGAGHAWLGLSDVGEEGRFLLPSGQPPTFTKWQPGEPNNNGGGQDCANFWPDEPDFADRWDDTHCDDDKPFLCEQHEKLKAENEKLKAEDEKLKAEIEKLKAEDEKFKAEDEKRKAENEILKAEDEKLKAEDEKLKAEVEKLKAEDEKLKAEDDKREAENEKLKAEHEQLEVDAEKLSSRITKVKCRQSWTFYGESCYKYVSVATTWQNAQVECESMEARLVEIDSEAENSFVVNMVVSKGVSYGWLGLSDVGVERQFLLPSGQPPTFTKWRPGEPNDSEGKEDCAMFGRFGLEVVGYWNDVPCDINNPFVCEQHVLF